MAVKYSACDKDMFIQILANYPIIEDKKTDSYNIEKKKKAWENIALEYNDMTTEKRTVVQLKRLWDKMKRSRKNELAEERRYLQPIKDYEIDTADDSDGININRKVGVIRVIPEAAISSVSHALGEITPHTEGQSSGSDISSKQKKTDPHIDNIMTARLSLIEMERQQLEELHKVRMEEANYRKEAARLVMLQEKAKLKKLNGNLRN